jgi:hypothetical protein
MSKTKETTQPAPAPAAAAEPSGETIYCYHCGIRHPKEEMRQVETKGVKRWRCIKSIKATKRGTAERDAFGQRVSAINKAEAQARIRKTLNVER